MGSLTRVLAACLLALVSAPALAQAPDTILVNGKIVTVDDRFTIAEALAIRNGRIVATGSTTDIEKLKGPQTRTIDLNRRTVIPGLIDNHFHLTRAVATCTESDSIEELMEMMTHGRFRHMPVVDNGLITGIVSIGDVVKTRIAETVQEAASLREYITAA